jgi:hypothetical protein
MNAVNTATELGLLVGGLATILGLAGLTVGVFVLRVEYNALVSRVQELEKARIQAAAGGRD